MPTTPSPSLRTALLERTPPGSQVLSFADYMECVLYHPQLGYYTSGKARIGRHRERDFYTASSLGKVFSSLVLSTLQSLAGQPLETFTFIEIGPETKQGILSGLETPPFSSCRQLRHGDPVDIPSPAIVFSNEVFDAQPFRRFIRKEKSWRELGVRVGNHLEWALMPASPLPDILPSDSPEGYVIDWPSGASGLIERLLRGNWTGLFVAFDYGLPLDLVLRERPGGTARTYFQHQMGTDLLESPGTLDLTCYVIWELLEESLRSHGFEDIRLDFQESFFMHYATPVIQSIVEQAKPGFSREKQTLMELLHPDNMGRKFQVLHANRGIR